MLILKNANQNRNGPSAAGDQTNLLKCRDVEQPHHPLRSGLTSFRSVLQRTLSQFDWPALVRHYWLIGVTVTQELLTFAWHRQNNSQDGSWLLCIVVRIGSLRSSLNRRYSDTFTCAEDRLFPSLLSRVTQISFWRKIVIWSDTSLSQTHWAMLSEASLDSHRQRTLVTSVTSARLFDIVPSYLSILTPCRMLLLKFAPALNALMDFRHLDLIVLIFRLVHTSSLLVDHIGFCTDESVLIPTLPAFVIEIRSRVGLFAVGWMLIETSDQNFACSNCLSVV